MTVIQIKTDPIVLSERTALLKKRVDYGQPNAKPKSTPLLQVLVVDDEPAVREGLVTWLGDRQFSVTSAADIRSAVQAASNHKPDVILLDVRLGTEDGLQLMNMLRSLDLEIPCVVLTGHAGPYDGFKARDLGVIDLLEKPLPPDEIAAALRRAVLRPRSEAFAVGTNSPRISTQQSSSRSDRIGLVLASLLSSTGDVHSLEGLCERAPIGVASTTFRRWCHDLRIDSARSVEFARLLPATMLAGRHGTGLCDWLDMDQRTLRKVLNRGGLSELFIEKPLTCREFIERQRFLRNPLVLSAVRQHCLASGDARDAPTS